MKIRMHAGGLSASMYTAAEIQPTATAVAAYVAEHLKPQSGINPEQVSVEPYGGIDPRIGWDTYIVLISGQAVGFTDGPLQTVNASEQPKAAVLFTPEHVAWLGRKSTARNVDFEELHDALHAITMGTTIVVRTGEWAALYASHSSLLAALRDVIDTGFTGGPQGKRALQAIAVAEGLEPPE